MSSLHLIHEKYVEIVARALLYKQRQAEYASPDTDDWIYWYQGTSCYPLQQIQYNAFRAEVSQVVSQLILCLDKPDLKQNIELIPHEKTHKADRCQLKVNSTGTGWYDGDKNRCSKQARYRIDGLNFCKQHAGQYLLDKALKEQDL